ncbi:MAG: ribosome maturation factor RimM [Oscillospiraceae bacterium]|nr:ribosome maturation factor RimM [Oscillospiraceae bacterium]
MKQEFIETGVVANTHGVRGEVKIVPWTDEPDTLCGYKRLFIEGREYPVRSARVHGGNVLVNLTGVEDVNAAMLLKGKTVYIAREDIRLPDGAFLLADIIGARVVDERGGEVGVLTDILDRPAQSIYVVEAPEREILIPDVDEFILNVDAEAGVVTVRLIEGM